MANLLVVEDEANQRLLYQEALGKEGYRVQVAENAKEALKKIDEELPDLVILDIRMPEMDGLEALGRIMGKDKTIPVIIYTAYSGYKNHFMSWSADAYLVKSSDLTELKNKVREILKERRVL
jgi:DNA-binding NtrC family response regulator